MTPAPDSPRWTTPWLDALAFAAGLAVAWLGAWTATDLVWSLWLSSLVVGYAMIVWRIAQPVVAITRGARRDWKDVRVAMTTRGAMPAVATGSILLIGGLFTLAFFTVHFGFFHYVHSQFLAMFFPLDGNDPRQLVGVGPYTDIVQRYWTFLPAAFLAERAAFLKPARVPTSDRSVTSVAIAARKARGTKAFGGMLAPYRNVVRMHMLIFFFAFASFAALDNFAVYAVVYAVYFFPWRLVRRARIGAIPAIEH